MNTEWIIRGAMLLIGHALGAKGKSAAKEKAAWEGIGVGIQLGSEATRQEVQRRINKEAQKRG